MGFFKRFAEMIGGGRGDEKRFLTVYVLTNRCREPIAVRVDLHNEVSRIEGDDGYYVRKVIQTSGAKRCFDQVEVELWLDKNQRVTNREVQGGRWLEEEEYVAELEQFNAPPEDPQDGETDVDQTVS